MNSPSFHYFSFIVANIVQEGYPKAHCPQDGHRLVRASGGTKALLQIRMKHKMGLDCILEDQVIPTDCFWNLEAILLFRDASPVPNVNEKCYVIEETLYLNMIIFHTC